MRGDVMLNLISIYKALGGGWQIRQGQDVVTPETVEAMRQRTDWGRLLPGKDLPDALPEVPPRAKEQPLLRRPDW